MKETQTIRRSLTKGRRHNSMALQRMFTDRQGKDETYSLVFIYLNPHGNMILAYRQ